MTPVLRAKQVAYHYIGSPREPAPIPLSLELSRGDCLLLCGPSGSGKSTLARCLTGLIPHLYRGELEGAVWLNGWRTASTPLWQLMEHAGLVFQNPAGQMLASTVEDEVLFGLENLGLAPADIRDRLEGTLDRFALQHLRRRAPRTLSGGEQQKLALASIIARRPELLVLDEPFSMLDSTAASALAGYLAEQAAAGTSLVVCEHRHEYLSGIPGLRSLTLPGVNSALQGASLSETPLPAAAGDETFYLDVAGLQVSLGGRLVLQDLNLALRGGEVTAIVGRNGVGKTTLLRTLAGLQRYEGRIAVQDGHSSEDARPQLGLVFQNADLQLFNGTVREEILYQVPNPDMRLYAWLLATLALEAYESTPPLLLSEGEKKRVALATILMRRPRHGLLLDEPALGQDTVHKTLLIGTLRSLAATGHLAIFTTHDLMLAAKADRLLLLGPRGILADGSPSRVFENRGIWQAAELVLPPWVQAGVRP